MDSPTSFILECKKLLFSAFHDWIQHHETILGNWYIDFRTKEEKAWKDSDTAIKIMGTSMWMFNMIAQFGVLAGLGPDGPKIHKIAPDLDEKLTKRLLILMPTCMNLQFLPSEIATAKLPDDLTAPWAFSLHNFALQLKQHKPLFLFGVKLCLPLEVSST